MCGKLKIKSGRVRSVARDAFMEGIVGLLSGCSSVCLSGTGVHCDHTEHVSAELSLRWIVQCSGTLTPRHMSTYSQPDVGCTLVLAYIVHLGCVFLHPHRAMSLLWPSFLFVYIMNNAVYSLTFVIYRDVSLSCSRCLWQNELFYWWQQECRSENLLALS